MQPPFARPTPPAPVPFSSLEADAAGLQGRAVLQAQLAWLRTADQALARRLASITLNRNQQTATQAYAQAVRAAIRYISDRLADLEEANESLGKERDL